MSAPLFSLVARGSHSVEIRKSRFLAQSAPVEDVNQALAFVREVSHADANHNCRAWRIGQEYRFHDDGEPSGSAGKPILAAIDGQNLDGVVVVVTRWFGGTKLGIGGLIRAYGGTAAECLRLGERKPIVQTDRVWIECAYPELAIIKSRLQALQVTVRDEEFRASDVRMHASVPTSELAALRKLVADVTHGRGRVERADPIQDACRSAAYTDPE